MRFEDGHVSTEEYLVGNSYSMEESRNVTKFSKSASI
jgi:hypothetical protein